MGDNRLIQFYNCRILRDHQIIDEHLWIRGGKFVNPEKVFFDERKVADVRIDCKGRLIAPGFIDIQINGGFGVDFSHDIDSVDKNVGIVARGILAHGVTSFCPTVVTSEPQVYRKVLYKLRKTQGGKHGATVLGAHVEGPFISPEKKGAHLLSSIVTFDKGFDSILEIYGNLSSVAIITLAPELPHSMEVIDRLVSEGITVSIGHSSADINIAEQAVSHGASLITHLFNAMLPFHHRDPGIIGLLSSDHIDSSKVYYGIIADGVHTHPSALRIAYSTHPKGLIIVTDAISALGLDEGTHFLGEKKIEIKNNCAYIAGTSTLCGSITPFNACVQHFMKSTRCSLVEALEVSSVHPAKALGIAHSKGTLDFDSDADFVILDDDLNVYSTWIAGDCVYQSTLLK
uniref:N-acetylglucosamine-6-phosphate deacetylase n=1 Tax=Cacopsylla melanoneura TaxID=428564 RepID=A0A8D8SFI7_9HEMI